MGDVPLKVKQIMAVADRRVAKKCDEDDERVALQLVETIKLIEHSLFNQDININFFEEINSWGIEATYHSETMEYDIYVPELASKLQKVHALFPDKFLLKSLKKKLIFIAAHKIRHRIQVEESIALITPNHHPEDILLNSIIKTIRDNAEHNECSCCFLDNPSKYRIMEFDAMIIQHYILSRLGEIDKYNKISEIPRFIWTSIADDLLIEG
ncbi:MAG: hypothetical protein ACOCRX_07885 [Candidatus Woesearchaeota archaeon]